MTLLLNNNDIQQVLTAEMTLRALEVCYKQLIEREAVCRPRIDIRIPTKTPGRFYQWGTMEGGSTSGYFAIRMKSDVLQEQEYTGAPLAIMNDGYLQHLRVAADGAIGAKIMSRKNSQVLGMLGSGGMARSHVEALIQIRNIKRIQVFSPTRGNREKYARDMTEKYGIEAIAMNDPREIYRGADILAGCTDSTVPVIKGEWLEEGMHVIAVGGRPDDAAKKRFDVTLRLGTAPAPVGRPELGTADEYLGYMARPDAEFWQHRRLGKRAPAVTGQGKELMFADIVNGKTPGRSADRQITYSERGNIQGAQFYAVAAVAYEAAKKRGLGHELPTEWFLQDIRD